MPTKQTNRFTSLTFFEVPKGWTPDPDKLKAAAFFPTEPTQELSTGFVSPRSGNTNGDFPFVEPVSGMHVVRLRNQTRNVPKSAIDHAVAVKCETIEKHTGRKPGRKEKKELKEEARFDLLPRAFTREKDSWGIVCPTRGLLIVNSASVTGASFLPFDLVNAHAVSPDQLAPGTTNLMVRPIRTTTSADVFMMTALTEPEKVEPFALGASCTLVAQDESRRQVSYRNQGRGLQENEEIVRYLRQSYAPMKLGLRLESSGHFEMDTKLCINKLEISDDLFSASASESAHDNFDADLTISALGIVALYDALIESLGVERMDDPKPNGLF